MHNVDPKSQKIMRCLVSIISSAVAKLNRTPGNQMQIKHGQNIELFRLWLPDHLCEISPEAANMTVKIITYIFGVPCWWNAAVLYQSKVTYDYNKTNSSCTSSGTIPPKDIKSNIFKNKYPLNLKDSLLWKRQLWKKQTNISEQQWFSVCYSTKVNVPYYKRGISFNQMPIIEVYYPFVSQTRFFC